MRLEREVACVEQSDIGRGNVTLEGLGSCGQEERVIAAPDAEQARDRDGPADAEQLAKLRERYDETAAFGITHNRHRDWRDGNHPGYVLGCWLQEYADQVWLFTRQPAVGWTNTGSEQGAKAAKRHQAVSGCWHAQRTLARWCRIRSYLDSAAAHGITALDAITTALAGSPWLPAPAAN